MADGRNWFLGTTGDNRRRCTRWPLSGSHSTCKGWKAIIHLTISTRIGSLRLGSPCRLRDRIAVDLSSRIGYRASLALARPHNPRWRYARDLLRGTRDRAVAPRPHRAAMARGLERGRLGARPTRQCARLLRSRPQPLGLAATAWFYDPQLADVSPRLCYCRERLLERGAIMMRVGTSDFDIASATARSSTRRTLYEARQVRAGLLHTAMAARAAAEMG